MQRMASVRACARTLVVRVARATARDARVTHCRDNQHLAQPQKHRSHLQRPKKPPHVASWPGLWRGCPCSKGPGISCRYGPGIWCCLRPGFYCGRGPRAFHRPGAGIFCGEGPWVLVTGLWARGRRAFAPRLLHGGAEAGSVGRVVHLGCRSGSRGKSSWQTSQTRSEGTLRPFGARVSGPTTRLRYHIEL